MQYITKVAPNVLEKYRPFIRYCLISAFVTSIDIAISWTFEKEMSTLIANTCGVVTGFTIQYFLTTRFIYADRNKKTFTIFLFTFFIGLIIANTLVLLCRTYIFLGENTLYTFTLSKMVSMTLPFFVTYYLRKWLIVPEN